MSDVALDAVAVATTAILALLLLNPRVARRPAWRATITPLASIIGSGFLVVGPLLSDIAGVLAPLAMAGLCALAWLFGSAIRYNIAHAEPLRDHPDTAGMALSFDRFADLCLAFAYFISVSYYLNLLGAYLIKGAGMVDPTLARSATTAAVLVLGAVGFLRGFRGLERIEVGAVSFKLAVIAGTLLVLALALLPGPDSHLHAPVAMHETPTHVMRVLLGCVILVQGFETSRFLGRHYPAALRIRSMRRAQWISSGIYVTFIALLMPHAPGGRPGVGEETQIVDILAHVAGVLGPLLVLAALASQLSAAVADMSGAGGLMTEYTRGRVNSRVAYAGIAVVAVLLTWSTDILGLIAYASRAFAVYYLLQCILAWRLARGDSVRRTLFAAAAALAAAVVLFGVAAD
ncbi:MAG: hypothetical protein WBV39_11770 [Rudaea sp.]